MDHQKQKIKDTLKRVDFHANWDIEKTSKSFLLIKQSIDEHLQDGESFTIEVHLLESYLYVSECKGMITKDFSKAIEVNKTACALIQQLEDGPIKDGYMSIYLAMCCWITLKKDQSDILSFENLEQLLAKYKEKYQDEDKKKFQASICVTKALALSNLSFSRYNESECQLVKATEACPDNPEWIFMLGLIKLQISKISLKKNESSSSLTEVEGIMKDVLDIKTNHAYAMVISADIKRRKCEMRVVEDDYDDEIIDLLAKSKVNASRPKILSLIAQCYIHMGSYCKSKRNKCNKSFRELGSLHLASDSTFTPMKYFSKARNVIDFAKDNFKKAACIIAQESVLYKEQENTEEELKCLDIVIQMKPSNVGAIIQKARALLHIGKTKEAFELYDELLVDFNDTFDLFDINRNYASSLAHIKEFDKAYDRNNACLEIAFKSFVKQTSSLQVEFIEEEDKQVQKVIGHVKKHLEINRNNIKFKKDPCKFKPSLDLAEFHDRLGQLEEACTYYKEALRALIRTHKAHDMNQEIYILLKLTNVHIKLDNLSDAEKMLEELKDAEEKQDIINKLKIDLAVAKGEKDAKLGEHAEAIKHFVCAAKLGSFEGAKRLLREMKKETTHQDLIKNCALVKKRIMETSENGSMLDDLNKLVRSYDDGCLMNKELLEIGLREYQLEMELGYLSDPEDPDNNMKIDTVIRKTRSAFNYAMTRFRDKHYPETTKDKIWTDTTDFFIVYCEADDVEKAIVKKISTIYEWTDFQRRFPSLLRFLVSIQPEIDPRNNKWIKEFFKLDDTVEHKYPLDSQLVSQNIDTARRACFRLRPILEEFCKYL